MQAANVVNGMGVHTDNSFPPSIHCREATSKSRRMLFMLRRSLAALSVFTFASHYYTLLRPNIEYATRACSPNLATDADCVEQIQSGDVARKRVNRRLSFEEHLRPLGLHTLNRRRLRENIIAAYKVFLWASLLFMPPVPPGLRGHSFTFLQGQSWRIWRKWLEQASYFYFNLPFLKFMQAPGSAWE